ncbi:MAG: TIM barrel protein [Chloroflexi bacterium]|nr:TIM barrel protein [Chloroflexota bacterium]
MDKLLFGTGGVPRSTRPQTTLAGIERIAELGLGCMEVEFVQRVSLSEAAAEQVAELASRLGVKLSAHASYYINMNAREPEKVAASQQRLLHAARIASICGAQSVIVHAAFYLGDPPETAYATIKKHIEEVMDTLKKENNRIKIRPELMGRPTQFGTLDEILKLSSELPGLAPCIDVAHWHARTGKFNTYPEFAAFFSQIGERLGKAALQDIHIHFSGIKYGAKGEISHLNLAESDFNYKELLQAFKDLDVKGLIICESPNLEEDALLLQKTYLELAKTG